MREIKTNAYIRSHGRTPRGRGLWLFRFQADAELDYFSFNGTFGAACKAARAEARRRNATYLEVMP